MNPDLVVQISSHPIVPFVFSISDSGPTAFNLDNSSLSLSELCGLPATKALHADALAVVTQDDDFVTLAPHVDASTVAVHDNASVNLVAELSCDAFYLCSTQ